MSCAPAAQNFSLNMCVKHCWVSALNSALKAESEYCNAQGFPGIVEGNAEGMHWMLCIECDVFRACDVHVASGGWCASHSLELSLLALHTRTMARRSVPSSRLEPTSLR